MISCFGSKYSSPISRKIFPSLPNSRRFQNSPSACLIDRMLIAGITDRRHSGNSTSPHSTLNNSWLVYGFFLSLILFPFLFLVLRGVTQFFVSPRHDFRRKYILVDNTFVVFYFWKFIRRILLLCFFLHSVFLLRFLLFLWCIQYGFVVGLERAYFVDKKPGPVVTGSGVWQDIDESAFQIGQDYSCLKM